MLFSTEFITVLALASLGLAAPAPAPAPLPAPEAKTEAAPADCKYCRHYFKQPRLIYLDGNYGNYGK